MSSKSTITSPKKKTALKTTALEKLSNNSKATTLKPPIARSQQERDEDAYIAHLEAKLGYSKDKKSKRFDDGLDDLFDFADSLERPFKYDENDAEEYNIEDEDDDDDDDEDDVLDQNDDEEPVDMGNEEEEVEDDDRMIEEEEWLGIEHSDEVSEQEGPASSTLHESTSSAPATRYVPPHLRAKFETQDSEEQTKLLKQLKGLLNRMSEQNIASMLESIEGIYRDHRRHDVTSTITNLIIDGISSHSSLLDSYVVLYAAFVSSLHKVVGIEFAAYFIQNVVSSYEKHLSTVLSTDTSITGTNEEKSEENGKEASNLIVLLSELYNFQVISSVLVFDIIRALLNQNIQEFQVELLLKIVRNSGQQLRTDDPLALKDIILIIQNKLDGQEAALSSRTRFMLETLNNLKNNKLKRLGTQNQGGEAVERMKKFLSGVGKKRHVLSHEPLRVTLDDLHSAETKGKWWLVGAAWSGDPLTDRQQDSTQTIAVTDAPQSGDPLAGSALLKLAKKHGMNTDIRRSIFVVLMSSDDYVDACERLSQLKLTEVQQREIVRVLLHCCGNEKAYNPYYTLVCQQLCSLSHSYKITLQYCMWDFLRDLGETNVGGAEVIKSLHDGGDFEIKSISSTRIKNLAKAYAWWIAKGSITLAVLKPIDFTLLKPQTRTFLQQLFIGLFLSSQSKSPLMGTDVLSSRNRASIEDIFVKASRLQTLSMGLIFFLSKGLVLDDVDIGIVKLVEWGKVIGKDALQSGLPAM
ncbi:hypothetical protein BDP27DRAFT_1318955 [Rhodocollybia butyracea]|uniref:MI domain-containing protein n=1 Tax=Rhodocollybia butyracea TaxID=206335 RepID=A0A9P5Q4K2_9AGAR|nr:hypothetical protein BDP27DRAFT_1318955 [Rhodocollybia butyracea]